VVNSLEGLKQKTAENTNLLKDLIGQVDALAASMRSVPAHRISDYEVQLPPLPLISKDSLLELDQKLEASIGESVEIANALVCVICCSKFVILSNGSI